MDPREFGAQAEGAVNDTDITNMHSLDKWFAEIASKMKEKAPRRRIAQDPRIKELIGRRIAMPRSRDGRARKELTLEIRKIIRTDTRNKKGGRQRSIRQTHQLGKDGKRASDKQATGGPGLQYRGKKHDIRRRSHRSHSAAHRKDLQRARTTDRHTTVES